MSWRNTGFRLAGAALAAVLLPSCGGGGNVRPDDGPAGEILKISYYRVNQEAKTKRPEPNFRAVMSETWRQVLGENPRDPLAKAAPNKVFKGFAGDPVMTKYILELRDRGLDRLRSHNADDCNPTQVYQQAMSPVDRDHPRIITLGTDKSAKSYSYHDQNTEELSRIFIDCEKRVSAIMDGHTIMVRIEPPRAVIPEK